MSWDVWVCKFSSPYADADQIPDDERPVALGTRAEVHAAISSVFTTTTWADPAWGAFESDIGSVEFNIGTDDQVEHLMLHVRAQDEIVSGIVALCAQHGWQALDMTSGGFLEQMADPHPGIRDWRTYLAAVLQKGAEVDPNSEAPAPSASKPSSIPKP